MRALDYKLMRVTSWLDSKRLVSMMLFHFFSLYPILKEHLSSSYMSAFDSLLSNDMFLPTCVPYHHDDWQVFLRTLPTTAHQLVEPTEYETDLLESLTSSFHNNQCFSTASLHDITKAPCYIMRTKEGCMKALEDFTNDFAYHHTYVRETLPEIRCYLSAMFKKRDTVTPLSVLDHTQAVEVDALCSPATFRNLLVIPDELKKRGKTWYLAWQDGNSNSDKRHCLARLQVKYGHSQQKAKLIHTIAIGYLLNDLYVPHGRFAYTFGGFYCPMKEHESHTVQELITKVSECHQRQIIDEKTSVATLVFTECLPSLTIADLDSATVGASLHRGRKQGIEDRPAIDLQFVYDLKSVLILVAQALQRAQEKHKFVHFNLRNDSVVLHELAHVPTRPSNQIDTSIRYIPIIGDFEYSVYEADRRIYNGFDAKLKHEDELENLRNTSQYFMSGYDIFMYMTSVFYFVYNTESNHMYRPWHQRNLNNLFRACLKPFVDRIPMSTRDLTSLTVTTQRKPSLPEILKLCVYDYVSTEVDKNNPCYRMSTKQNLALTSVSQLVHPQTNKRVTVRSMSSMQRFMKYMYYDHEDNALKHDEVLMKIRRFHTDDKYMFEIHLDDWISSVQQFVPQPFEHTQTKTTLKRPLSYIEEGEANKIHHFSFSNDDNSEFFPWLT
jgi:hypothetical protein